MYNYNKLLGRITELGMTKDDLAKKIGMSRTTLYYKLNCESEFTQEEIQRCAEVLDFPSQEIPLYFFNTSV